MTVFFEIVWQFSILWAVANSIQIPIFPAQMLRDLCPEHQHSLYRVAGRSSESVMELCMVECQLGSGCILPLMRLEMLTHSYSYSGWLKCNAMCATSTYCTCTHTHSLTGHAKETNLTLTTAHVQTKVVMLVCQRLSDTVQHKIKPQL